MNMMIQTVLIFLESDGFGHRGVHNKAKPFQRRDPLADDILRQQRRFHESLRQSHLCFSVQVMTEQWSTARLMGSVLAESAFEQGHYRLLLGSNADPETSILEDSVQTADNEHSPDLSDDDGCRQLS